MDISSASVLVSAAVTMGIVHAFDADHLATVAAFASTSSGKRQSLRYSLHWAVGHGTTLIVLALLVYVSGLHIPPALSQIAEALIGVVLIAMGVWLLRGVTRFYRSGGTAPALKIDVNRKPLAIGSLHGLAGSAPLLLVFLVDISQPLLGLGLVLVFVAGVCLSMMAIGLLLGVFIERVNRAVPAVLQVARAGCASLAVLVGGMMVYGNL